MKLKKLMLEVEKYNLQNNKSKEDTKFILKHFNCNIEKCICNNSLDFKIRIKSGLKSLLNSIN